MTVFMVLEIWWNSFFFVGTESWCESFAWQSKSVSSTTKTVSISADVDFCVCVQSEPSNFFSNSTDTLQNHNPL